MAGGAATHQAPAAPAVQQPQRVEMAHTAMGLGLQQPMPTANGQPIVAHAVAVGPPPVQQTMAPPLVSAVTGPGFDALAVMPRVLVKEQINMVQVLTALVGAEINMAQKYNVVDHNKQDVFFAVERTTCMRRQCKQCFPDCIGWDTDVLYTFGGQQTRFMHLQRDDTCTFCCFNRPKLVIYDEVHGGQVIGSITDPWACCDLTFKMMDPNEKEVLWIKGGCCQPGFICPLPCGPCQRATFDIQDASSGQSVGQITKIVPDCFAACCSKETNNYEIEFGHISHPTWKAMLIALSIFIDFRYFSNGSRGRGGGSAGEVAGMGLLAALS